MPNLQSVLEHCKSIHKIKRTSPIKVKDMAVEPDQYDPNVYGESCIVTCAGKAVYRLHLTNAHDRALKRLSLNVHPKPDVAPDPNGPNLYCKSCGHTCTQKYKYKPHSRWHINWMLK